MNPQIISTSSARSCLHPCNAHPNFYKGMLVAANVAALALTSVAAYFLITHGLRHATTFGGHASKCLGYGFAASSAANFLVVCGGYIADYFGKGISFSPKASAKLLLVQAGLSIFGAILGSLVYRGSFPRGVVVY